MKPIFERNFNPSAFDRKQLKRELGERYLQILDAIHDMVLVKGPQSRIVWASRAFREYYGMSNEQLENIVDVPFNATGYTEQYIKDDAYVFSTGKVLDIPREKVTRRDGVVRIFHTVKSPIVDASGKVIMTVGVSRDITDHEVQEKIINEQRIEMARQRSEARYRALFEMMIEGFVIHELLYDETGKPCDLRYLEVNPAFERYTGLKNHQVVGRTMYELFPGVEPLWFERFSKVVITGEHAHFEARFGPIEKWLDVSVYRTDLHKFAVIFYDITERKLAQSALLAAKEAAEISTRMKARFLDIAAHELRTPVSAFSLMLQFSQKQLENKGIPVDPQTLDRIRGQADRLSRLVVDLLDVSRLERGLVKLKRELVDIAALTSECIDSFKLQSQARQFHISKPERPIPVDLDPLRIYQVLSNLLDNSIKYTPQNAPIEITLEATPDIVRVSVKDQGFGIPEKQRASLFEPFSRGLSDQEERAAGLGLGLFISNSIIELHGGTMKVQSKEGEGSIFSFELPRKVAS